jgi:dephospho-CoA kinase
MDSPTPTGATAANVVQAQPTWASSTIAWSISLVLFWYLVSILLRKMFGGKIIGITGGIASGKTTFVNRMMAVAPIPVIDFDLISRDVSSPGCDGWVNLRKVFPPGMFNSTTGELLRDELGKLVFANATERKRLNEALKVPMRNLFLWQLYGVFFVRRQRVAFVVAPLLFEMGLHWICSKTLCVVIENEEEQLRRLAIRDNLPVDQVRARVASQMPTSRKRALANVVVLNNGSLEQLAAQADAFLMTQGDLFEVMHDDADHDHTEEEKLMMGGEGGRHSHLEWIGKQESWVEALKPNLMSMVGGTVITTAIFGVYFGFLFWGHLCALVLQ